MQAEESMRNGDLSQALIQLQEQIKANPAKAEYRVFLFQLLSVCGFWGRALTQLDVAAELDPKTLAMVQTYREALRCEALREEVFSGLRSPTVFGEPEHWIALCLRALELSSKGQSSEATKIREEAFALAPATSGAIDGEEFEWLADADSRIGPFIEAVVQGVYYWIPVHRIATINFEEPEDLRDMVWTPAQFTWSNGGQAVGLIPTRYEGSEKNEDDKVKLAQKTIWEDAGDDCFSGIGQRVFSTDAGEYSLLDVREIVFESASQIDFSAEPPQD